MSKKVSIGNSTYTLTQQGDPAGWGEDQQELVEALIDTVNNFFGPGDIVQTTVLIGNNVSTPTNINNFQFDVNVVRFAEVNYTVIRVATDTVFEVGKLFILNDPTIIGNPWSLNQQNMSENQAGITFSINSSGQIQYTTDEMLGTYLSSESKIVFSAKAIVK